MTDAYDDWQEARKRLSSNPSDAFLTNVEQTLRPLAIHDLCERLVGAGWHCDDEAIALDDSQVASFLSELDQLRGMPVVGEVEREASKMRVAVDSALAGMARLNYTGDHTHFEVLDDARQVLNEVLHGRPFPKLERFRCPSIYETSVAGPYQCTLQLPHECSHTAETAYGPKTWTDKESKNPPVPYEDPSTDPCPCTFYRSGVPRVSCMLPAGHGPDHRAEDGTTWVNDYQPDRDAEELDGHPVRRCSEWFDAAAQRGRCEHNEGHSGPHEATGYGDWGDTCNDQHVRTLSDGGAEDVVCSMYKDHAGPLHFDVRSGSSWPVS